MFPTKFHENRSLTVCNIHIGCIRELKDTDRQTEINTWHRQVLSCSLEHQNIYSGTRL